MLPGPLFPTCLQGNCIQYLSRLSFSGSLISIPLFAQSPPQATSTTITADKAIDLAQHGRCKEAIPELKRAVSLSGTSTDVRKQAAVMGLRCALATDDRNSADTFLQQMYKQFPKDPDILYIVVHAYSDLSTRSAEDLARSARSLFRP